MNLVLEYKSDLKQGARGNTSRRRYAKQNLHFLHLFLDVIIDHGSIPCLWIMYYR